MPLQCSKYDPLTEALTDEAIRTAIGCGFQSQFGSTEVFGLIVLTGVFAVLWVRTESIIMPWTLFMLTGGIILPFLTSTAITIVMLAVAGVGAAVPLAVARRSEVRG